MSLILGLWSIVLEPGKTYSQSTNPAIQITNISYGAEVKGDARSVVSIKYPEFEQDSDDESESESEEDVEEKELDEEEDEDDESPIKLPNLITKEAVIAILKPNQTEQVSVNISLVEDTEVVEFSVTGPNSVHLIGNYIRQEDFDQDPYSDEEGESEFDSDDEDIPSDFDEDDEDLEGLSGLIDGEDSDEESEMDEDRFEEVKEEKKVSATNPKKRAAEEEAKVADSANESLSKNQKKKLAKKLKGDDGKAAAPAAAPVAAPKEEAPKKAPSKTQTLPGGLVITDAKIGDGPVAKSGSKVGMRYIGKLDSGKIFDSNTKGTPLSFTLGRGQVISGWDKGIAGMRVGGERKLVIPASMAYGKKGTQGIPGGATLTFDCKLVSCK